jgi:hypothetical protein
LLRGDAGLERSAEVKLWWQACRLHFSNNPCFIAGTAASTARGLHFPRNALPNLTEYPTDEFLMMKNQRRRKQEKEN